MSNYCFPIQSAKDIAAFLKRCYNDVDISEKDIRSPELPMTSELSHPEIHEDATPLFNLLRCMQALLTTCGINDFKMSDIIAPKPKRVISIMSALMNFLFFQEERFEVYQKLKNENDALQDQREMLLSENEEYKQRINAIKARQAEMEVEVDAILKSIDEWNEKTSVLHQTVATKQKQSNDNKLMIAELKSNLTRFKDEIIQEKGQNSRLAAKIVPSPDRLKGEMERMQRQLVQAEQSKQKLETRLAELTKRHQLLQERDQEADMALRCVEAIQQENDKQKTVLTAISNIQEESSNKHTEIKHLDAKVQQLTLQISNKQEKMEKLSIQHNLKINDKKAALEHLESELSNMQQVYGKQHSQSQAIQAEIKMVKEKQQEENLAYEETMLAIGQKYKEMLNALDLYHQRFAEACHKVIST
ncbi:hypothetical protein LSH36_97g06019 [Paralvinella palmiformis]|uniref:Kinetochore protein Nuf2 N-terminal domain-containing protein n=1 Tax=Paralvinella palmiformis TaxID=53620 RepID=A0AAD9JZU5_9ANNE|nr:hypothetical protein LSH36_97g06019 [Paralvinella palmiformis]